MTSNYALERSVRGLARAPQAPGQLWRLRRLVGLCRGPLNADVRRHMGPQCPNCERSEFSYRELLAVHPQFREWSPNRIRCPSCRAELRVTAMSRVADALSLLGMMAIVFLLAVATKSGTLLIVLELAAGFVLYSIVWSFIVRLKPWTPFRTGSLQVDLSATPCIYDSRRGNSVTPLTRGALRMGNVTPNYALERSVRGSASGAAGALEILAPAAPSRAFPRPAQRGR